MIKTGVSKVWTDFVLLMTELGSLTGGREFEGQYVDIGSLHHTSPLLSTSHPSCSSRLERGGKCVSCSISPDLSWRCSSGGRRCASGRGCLRIKVALIPWLYNLGISCFAAIKRDGHGRSRPSFGGGGRKENGSAVRMRRDSGGCSLVDRCSVCQRFRSAGKEPQFT